MPSLVGAGLSVIRRPAISVDIITVTPETGDATEVSNSLPWQVSSFSYLGSSSSITDEETSPTGMFFKPDGLKMYVIGTANDTVYQYTLSTAWDVSTATYDVVSFSIATQDVNPQGLFFKPDGTDMYVLGNQNNTVYQYSLSTAWDVSTATYDLVLFNVGDQDEVPSDLFFKPDGTKFYVVGNNTSVIYQYSVVTPWTIAAASYGSVSFSAVNEDGNLHAVSFKPDGLKMYVSGVNSDAVYQYSLSTAWDVSTATYDSISLSTASQDGACTSLFFKPDGAKFYITGSTTDTVYQYET